MAMLAELEAEQQKFTAIEPFIREELQMHESIYEACTTDFNDIYKFAQQLAEDIEGDENTT